MDSTWETRDFPVLEAVVRLCDASGKPVTATQVCGDTGLDEDAVQRAIIALKNEDPPLLAAIRPRGDGYIMLVGSVTGHARRLVGAWPTPDTLSDRIIDALNKAADAEQDTEKKSRLSHAADVGKGTLAGVLARVLTQGF